MFNNNSLTIKGSRIFRLKPGQLFEQVLLISIGIIFKNISYELFSKKNWKNPFSRFLHKNYGFLYHLSGKPRFMEVDSIVNYVYFVYFRIMMSKEWSSVQVQIPITTRHLPHE